jgi:polygalacturonase
MNRSRRVFLWRAIWLAAPWLLSTRPLWAAEVRGDFNVRDHGATGDGRTLDTRAIQAAINAAGQSGGTVFFPPGEYLSGSLHLRSHITLRLGAGSVLIASKEEGEFDPVERLAFDSHADAETTDFGFALLQGRDLADLSILGPGRIDGNRTRRGGPKPIALKRCRNILIRGLTIANAPSYNISLLGCDGVNIRGVTIRNGYSDGIDPDCCRNVRISNCHIESRDDAIVLKTSFALGSRGTTQNVRVTNCNLTTIHNALKLGTESIGHFRNIVFSNCTIVGQTHAWKGDLSSGVSLEMVDGGTLERVFVSDIQMTNVRAPLFVRLGNRGRGQEVPVAGTLRNVSISNVVAVGAMTASSITGIAGHPVSEIQLKNIRVTARGGARAEVASQRVPELEKRYPDAYMFQDLPAYGLYCRHVRRLTCDHVELDTHRPDARPALVLDDVGHVRMEALRAMPPAEGQPLVWLRSVQDCQVSGLRASPGTKAVLRLSGSDTARVSLVGNDFSQVEQVAIVDVSVAESVLRMEKNVMPRPPRSQRGPTLARSTRAGDGGASAEGSAGSGPGAPRPGSSIRTRAARPRSSGA